MVRPLVLPAVPLADLTMTLLAVTLTTSPWNGLRIRPTALGSTPHPPTTGRVNAHKSATAATHAVAADAFMQRLLLCWPIANAPNTTSLLLVAQFGSMEPSRLGRNSVHAPFESCANRTPKPPHPALSPSDGERVAEGRVRGCLAHFFLARVSSYARAFGFAGECGASVPRLCGVVAADGRGAKAPPTFRTCPACV